MKTVTLVLELDQKPQSVHLAPGEYILGRDAACDVVVDSPTVSRRHVRLRVFHGSAEPLLQVEDLASTTGTLLNQQPVFAPTTFFVPATLQLGLVPIQVLHSPPRWETSILNLSQEQEPSSEVSYSLRAPEHGHLPGGILAQQTQQRLELLYDLPLQFAAETDLEKLYRLILERVIELTPGAVRGALLVKEPVHGKLCLRASIPEEAPPISRTLIRRAALEHTGFIWGDHDSDRDDLSSSMAAIRICTGMYAPLVWKGDTVGVLCVDTPDRRSVFSQGDLQFLLSVAHYAASAVANQLLQHEIQTNNRTLENLLTNFSPKIRESLLHKSRQGRLQPGGEKSHVSILFSDLRGFTRTAAHLDASAVVEMLNSYFRVLGEIIFRHDGTIDKFMGDAILAVFGSPEPHPEHALQAVLAGIEMQRQVALLNSERQAIGAPFCSLGIGIHTGEVLHGFIGADERLEFTVIGDAVNKASRYCAGAGPGEVVLGPLTFEAVQAVIPATAKFISTKHEGELQAFSVDLNRLPPIEKAP